MFREGELPSMPTLFSACLFPGKDALILLLVGKAAVQKGLNWVRRKRGQPEFVFAHQV